MSFLAVESLTKLYGSVRALDNVSLSIESGEFITLLGPSGCGKTTFLRLIAGLERPTQGKVYLEGKCINDVPPHRRQIGMVVQNYALFPHMTVFDNVAYGLRVRRVGAAEVRKRVLAALELVRLPGYEHRFPRQLSGGEQQRCALARALVIEPLVFLLDEALGALDKNLRQQLQIELKQLQQTVGVTTIHVTHDQEEALGMSDRIVLLDCGHVEQIGSPIRLYEEPETEFVADFIGEANIFRAQVEGTTPEGVVTARSDDDYHLTLIAGEETLVAGSRIIVVVRPEYATISLDPTDQKCNVFPATVEAVVYQGNTTKVVVRLANERRLIVYEPSLLDGPRRRLRTIGEQVWVVWAPAAAHALRA